MQDNPQIPLLQWYDASKRDLPWRQTHDPYCIWLSEIMLQQTQVETVKAYYRRFLELFPTVYALAEATEEQVLKAWEGLGYYSRARNLHKAAKLVAASYNGLFPSTAEALAKLPGIGAYTAGAVASIAFGQRTPAVDGNVYRVISRFFGVREDIGSPAVQKKIAALALSLLPDSRAGDCNQALMELGATVCSPAAPRCDRCPWAGSCDAYAEGDMTLLPIREKKRPQRVIPVAVCLIVHENAVLVFKRQERLLKGLYVFNLVEDETLPEPVLDMLQAQGLHCAFERTLGTARHVFTHRIWEMTLFHFRLLEKPAQAALDAMDAKLATAAELDGLPMPTAMKAAKAAAMAVMTPRA